MAQKTKPKTINEALKDSKRKAICIAILVVLALMIGGSMTSKPESSDETDKEKTAETSQEDFQLKVEDYCQDAGLLRKYITDRVSIIDMLDYNDHFTDLGEDGGKHKYDFSWHGKNKDTGETVRFECIVSGESEKIKLETLIINSVPVYDTEEFTE